MTTGGASDARPALFLVGVNKFVNTAEPMSCNILPEVPGIVSEHEQPDRTRANVGRDGYGTSLRPIGHPHCTAVRLEKTVVLGGSGPRPP